MQTTHRIHHGDARSLNTVPDDAAELVVTSPPYPMIEMWDDQFGTLNPAITDALAAGDGSRAFDLMHDELAKVWDEVDRILVDGGIACINVGDATRTVDSNFRVYQNHARIIEAFTERDFEPLPDVLWRKPANSAAKFMGSGMIPPNAYVTLEHEYILVFRKGETRRSFEPGAERRYEAAYFWEERNRWFSDVWADVRGTMQSLGDDELRDRSGAYPFEIPYRLVNMYSVYGDTVVDPFWGTGTTSLAAMVAGRNSIGVELDEDVLGVFDAWFDQIPAFSRRVIGRRLAAHRAHVAEQTSESDGPAYESIHYGFPVRTKQERSIKFYIVDAVDTRDDEIVAEHSPVTDMELAEVANDSTASS